MSAPFRSRWLDWHPDNSPGTAPSCTLKTLKRGSDRAFDGFEGAGVRRDTPISSGATFDADAGELAAVKLTGTIIGDVWVVRDDDTLADSPDIIRSGLPVFFFEEVERLRGKTPEELKAIGLVKAEFPTSRVLQ
jgi:hypothetical protein